MGAEGRGFGQWDVRTKCGERVACRFSFAFFTYKYENTAGRRNLEPEPGLDVFFIVGRGSKSSDQSEAVRRMKRFKS